MKVETIKYFFYEILISRTMPWFNKRKYPNYVSQYTQKLQTLAYTYIEKKYINLKKDKRIPTKQLKAKILYTL